MFHRIAQLEQKKLFIWFPSEKKTNSIDNFNILKKEMKSNAIDEVTCFSQRTEEK